MEVYDMYMLFKMVDNDTVVGFDMTFRGNCKTKAEAEAWINGDPKCRAYKYRRGKKLSKTIYKPYGS